MVIENYTIRSGTRDFLLTFHSKHRPISYLFNSTQLSTQLTTPKEKEWFTRGKKL